MRKKIGFLKKAIAKIDGYFSPKGEKLVSARLTPAEVDAFNGVAKKKAAPAKAAKAPKTKAAAAVVAAPAVEVVEQEVVEPAAEAVLAEVPPVVVTVEEKTE